MSTLSTSKLLLRVGDRELVRDLDWSVQAGECWAVIGRNGAGKSTLLRTLAGLRAPDAGAVLLDDKPLQDWPLDQLAARRAFLPQTRQDAFGYRVLETVLAARHPYAAGRYWEDAGDTASAMRALAAMEVADLAQRDIRTLSGGERQRVAIAGLLAQQTPLLLLDEPATALDLAHQVSTMALLAALCRDEARGAVLVGHDLNLAYNAATHVLLLFGDGHWQAGPRDAIMQADILARCLGHPIEVVESRGRRIYIPAQP
ncbi:MAG TPA: ABC transporter ATP-binding protein [Burkholderiaceae bacterium]